MVLLGLHGCNQVKRAACPPWWTKALPAGLLAAFAFSRKLVRNEPEGCSDWPGTAVRFRPDYAPRRASEGLVLAHSVVGPGVLHGGSVVIFAVFPYPDKPIGGYATISGDMTTGRGVWGR